MKYKIKKQEKNQVEISMSFTKEEWANYIDKSYEQNKGKYKVEGFRNGKAPKSVIEKMYGEHIFIEPALNIAFQYGYSEVLEKEQDLEPIADPKIDIKKLDKENLELHLVVEVMPEVKLGAYEGLEIKKEIRKATAEEVEHELHHAQEHAGRIVEVEHDLENGNIAHIDFSGSIDGVKFEGGTATGYDLEIGSGSFIPGFEDQMVGMKKGETRDVKVTFPADYGAADLAGKEAVFEVKLHAIKEKQLPELDDEFAKDVSEFNTLEEYKKDIENHLNSHYAEHAERDAENDLIEEIAKNSEVEIPESMISQQQDAIMRDLEYRLMYQGLSLQDYAKYLDKTVEDIRAENKENAERMVKVRLVLEAIIKAEKLYITDEEVDAKLSELAKQEHKSLEEFKKSVNENRINYVKNDILMSKLINLLKEKNKISD